MCKPTGHCPETRHGPGRARRAREFSQFLVLSAIRGPRAFIYGRRTRYPPPGYVVCADSCVTTDPDPRASNVNPSCAHNTYHNRPKPGSTHTWIAHMDGHSRLTPSLTDTLYSGLISFECSERRRFLSLSLHLFSFFWQVSHFRIWSSTPFALDLSSCCRRMSAGADPRASGIEGGGLSTRHSPAPHF